MKIRIKYYEPNDMGYGHMVNKSLDLLHSFDPTASYALNDIIELYNVLKYIKKEIYTTTMTQEDIGLFKSKRKELEQKIGKYCATINDQNISELTQDLYNRYKDDLAEILDRYKIYQRINNILFETLLSNRKLRLIDVLQYNSLVLSYDSILTKILLSEPQAFNILSEKYLKKEHKIIFLPNSLSIQDKETIVKNYINSDKPAINELAIISALPVFDDFKISDETRYMAKEKHDKLISELFKNQSNVRISTNLQVSFSESQKEAFIYDTPIDSNDLKISIGISWLKENQDYATLLNNFIYLFNLVDSDEQRVANISKRNQENIFETINNKNGLVKVYPLNNIFELLNRFAIIQVTAYSEWLRSILSIRIEDVLQWFTDVYIKKEFDIDNFYVNMPSVGCTYLEKCRTMCCEIEGLLKQFDSFIHYGKVNHALIEISSTPINIRSIGSLLHNKYFYPHNNVCKNCMYLLFSDQTLLSYLPQRSEEREYPNLYELLLSDTVNYTEYEAHQTPSIDYLVNNRVLKKDKDGNISFYSTTKTIILRDLYENGFCVSDFYISKGKEQLLNQLQHDGWIKFESTFLSQQECDYFNYYLNKADFINGHDLRNRYLHGTQKKHGNDEELHKVNYYTLLMLYIIIVIKINQELCVRDDNAKKDTKE